MGKLKKEDLVDLPCYTTPTIQDDFRKKIFEISKKLELSVEDTKIIKIIAPLMDNPNSPNASGSTPILFSALNGHTEIVKILAPLTSNPNAPFSNGHTPIHVAAYNGHTDIVKILTPLIDINTNSQDNDRKTSLSVVYNYRNLKSDTSTKRKASSSKKPSRKHA